MDKYFETYLESKETKSTCFKSDIFLYQFSDLLDKFILKKNCFACLTQPCCVCKTGECDCDEETYSSVEKCKFEMVSNCNFIVDLKLSESLNKEKNKNLQQEFETLNLRIFYFDHLDNEQTLMYITRTATGNEGEELCYIQFRGECRERGEKEGEVFFELSDTFSTVYNDITFRFNYMNYKTSEEKKSGDKFTM